MFVGVLDRKFYPGVRDRWDDLMFREFVLKHLRASDVMLDLGAGAGIVEAMNFKGHARRICGIDLDPRVVDNPNIDEGIVGDGETLPYPSETFDLVIADNVVEHLEDPKAVFGEIFRVLKPNGLFLFKTPNRRHYMPQIALLTPLWFHKAYKRLMGMQMEDTFHTVYSANTPERVREVADHAGLKAEEIILAESRPEYLRLLSLTYLVGIAWERAVNRFERLARYRILLIAALRRPAAT
jgi:SAM-dependent methyltransferase